MSKKQHEGSHRYKRVNLGSPIYRDGKVVGKKKYIVYKCQKPNCAHYVIPALLEGKIAECPRCSSDFVCDKSSKTLAEPHCIDCTHKKKDAMDTTLKFIEDLANDID